MPEEHVVSRSTLIDAPAEVIWDALIQPSGLEEFADKVEAFELVRDAKFVFRWDGGRERRGVVEEVDAPERLALRWAGSDGEESRVVFELGEESGQTRVTVTESGLTAPRAPGWGPRLAMLGPVACAVLA